MRTSLAKVISSGDRFVPNTHPFGIVERQAMPKKTLCFGLLLALGIVACSSAKRGSSSSSAYSTEDKYCTAWAKAACNTEVVGACGAKDADACVAQASDYCKGLVPPGYASKYAKQCIDAVKSAFSDAKLTSDELKVVRDLAEPCHRLNEGPKGVGETCDAPDQCNALEGEIGLTCIIKAGQTQGTCQEPVEVGGGLTCSEPDQVCADGFYCDGNNCLGLKLEGKPCGADAPCAEGLYCLGPVGSATCQPKAGATELCKENSDCQSNICTKSTDPVYGKCFDAVVLSPAEPFCDNFR